MEEIKMNGDRDYWLKEAYRHLEIALIGIGKKQREHILKAIESLNKYRKDVSGFH
jgi:hypothetical protein